VKAIQTRYAGCHFRSRLEARWAVLFDHLGIPWEYEPQGFEIQGAHRNEPVVRYLPDFWLPEQGQWVEVKPTDALLDKGLMVRCVDSWSASCLPDLDESSDDPTRGLLLLGNIPRPMLNMVPAFTILGHHKGVQHQRCALDLGIDRVEFSRCGEPCWDCPMDVTVGGDCLNGGTCTWIDARPVYYRGAVDARRVNAGLEAARSARFEHGESGSRTA
jgi:hypothetical protein